MNIKCIIILKHCIRRNGNIFLGSSILDIFYSFNIKLYSSNIEKSYFILLHKFYVWQIIKVKWFENY